MRRLPAPIALAVLVAAAAVLAPATARADEPWLLGFEGDVAVPMLAPTAERFEPGALASVSLHRALGDAALLGLRLRAGFLADGPAPADPTLADPGVGDLYGASLSVRFRPLAPAMPGVERGTGLFVELGGGGVLTGGIVRPSAEAALGWGFAIEGIDLAPVVRWMTVFEVDGQLEDRPAHILAIGLEVSLFDARPSAEIPAEPAPPGDRDGDGYTDDVDGCTDEPEDFDGYRDEDGCPEADNDRDGYPDPDDGCPLEAEDFDGWEDEDGCPDRDNDGDGIPDEPDVCPNEAEVVNGVDDRDGCPDEGLIELVDDRVVLEERVLFDFARARVKSRARPVLHAIVELYRQHPEWVRLRIEGHADRRGGRAFNQRLSELRAQRVRSVLVEYGIPAEIIDAVGYGETRLRVWGTDEETHQLNRRVEFVVMARRELTPGELAAEQAAAERERAEARARRGEEPASTEGAEPIEAPRTGDRARRSTEPAPEDAAADEGAANEPASSDVADADPGSSAAGASGRTRDDTPPSRATQPIGRRAVAPAAIGDGRASSGSARPPMRPETRRTIEALAGGDVP
ncbi:MAG TPA: OmpA family protein [Sandaracinaceae bacterium LLY-WYZ-13_1]|nr:OmpA family protein [Sandaracinaceae bacterium LLY-WYZ-13_1]